MMSKKKKMNEVTMHIPNAEIRAVFEEIEAMKDDPSLGISVYRY